MRRWGVNAFIVVYVAAAVAGSMPGPAQRAPLRYLRDALRPIMLRAGLWQGWDMFANPPTTVDSVGAEVRLADGTSVTWSFPRMETLGYLGRYRQERFRKYTERMRIDRHHAAWPDAARFIARRVSRPGNPAEDVWLVHHWGPIPPPVGASWPPRLRSSTFATTSRFFHYVVTPADLP